MLAGTTWTQDTPAPPDPGKGHARGVMFYKGAPRADVPIYTNRVELGDFAASPSAHTDSSGHWFAPNLPPGKYVTTCFKIKWNVLPYHRCDVHEIKAGEVTDFGQENTFAADGIK
ncbi:MAG: hypothetical protein ABSH47_22190 [Bryobacteraceae bacterium]